MEIIDYIKAARRRLWLIILLPLLSAAVAAGILFVQPVQYTATATVNPPALVGGLSSQYTGAQGVNQFVAQFQATASSPVIRDKVEALTGADAADVNNNLSVTQVLASSSVAVSYTSPKKNEVSPVVEAASSLTLKALFSSQVDDAKARQDGARKALADTNAAIDAFTAKYKMADPQKAYEAQLSRVNALIQQQATLQAAGNPVGAAAMAAPIATAKASLDGFVPILAQYNVLQANRSSAAVNVNEADTAAAQAEVQLAAADPSKVVFVGTPQEVDRITPMVQTALAVAAAAFVLSLLLVFLLEVIARSRTTSVETTESRRDDLPVGRRHTAEPPAERDAPEDSTSGPGPLHPATLS